MKKIFISTFILFTSTTFGQTTGRLPNKTLKDSVFVKGDIIKIPEIVYSTCCLACLDGVGLEMKDSLNIVGNFILKHPKYIFQIGSHTDQRGNKQKNVELAQRRASSVKDYLVKIFPIDSTTISAKGYGGNLPIVNTETIQKAKTKEEKEKLHQINRRTDLTVIGIK